MAELSISLLILLDYKILFFWKKKKIFFRLSGNSVTYSPSVKSCNFLWEIHMLAQAKFQKATEIFWATRTLKCLFVNQNFLLFNKIETLGSSPTSLACCLCWMVMISSRHCPVCASWAVSHCTRAALWCRSLTPFSGVDHPSVVSIIRAWCPTWAWFLPTISDFWYLQFCECFPWVVIITSQCYVIPLPA